MQLNHHSPTPSLDAHRDNFICLYIRSGHFKRRDGSLNSVSDNFCFLICFFFLWRQLHFSRLPGHLFLSHALYFYNSSFLSTYHFSNFPHSLSPSPFSCFLLSNVFMSFWNEYWNAVRPCIHMNNFKMDFHEMIMTTVTNIFNHSSSKKEM